MKRTCVIVIVIGLMTLLNNCQYDNIITPSSNIILYDKPLDVIKVNVQGKWNLVKIHGGICGTCPVRIIKNPYLIITGDHIVAGNDSLGVTVDTIIVWKREIYNPPSEYTYLMGTPGPPGYPGGLIYQIVDRIQNDTLILIDYSSDPFYYHYLKTKQP